MMKERKNGRVGVTLKALEEYFSQIFTTEVTDSAINGIQIANGRGVGHLGVGVDFCAELITAAAQAKCDGLLVHHGLYWGKVLPLVGREYRLVRQMIMADMALLAFHLPLDIHPELGNNAGLISALNLRHIGNLGDYKGHALVFAAEVMETGGIALSEFVARYEQTIAVPLGVVKAHARRVQRVGICSGGGLFGLRAAQAYGCDTYLTGDANHIAYHEAKELPINVIFGGHYQTETFGVRRLARAMEQDLGMTTQFFDIPTNL